MRALACLCLLALAACVREAPVRRLAEPATVAVVLVHDRGSAVEEVPGEYAAALAAALRERNLVPELIAPARFSAELSARRETRHRLAYAAELSGAPYVLLVETRAEYFSQLSGRFRWTVDAKLTLARRGDLEGASSESLELPIVLQHEHQREEAAIAESARRVALTLGRLVDDFLAGADAATVPARADAERRPASIYFVLVDRFANGDPSNDAGADPADPQAFHGGDLAGLIARLDHIESLGFRDVWISPVWAMRTAKIGEHGAFHGYWTEDLMRVEPRFGTAAELERLAEELSRRDMGLVLDVVLNHVGPGTRLHRERPTWFHRNGPITDWSDPVQLTEGDVHGLPDLAQEREEVYRYLVDASAHWAERLEPAGFRLDAVKHVSHDFWRRYNAELGRRAGGELMLLGELYDGDVGALADGFSRGGFDALFDFPLHFALVDVFCRRQHPGRLAAVLSLDRLYPDRTKLVTFADNHDLPRVASACGGDLGRVAQLLRFQMTARGVPAMTYGTEIGLSGAKEPENRADMRFAAPMPLAGEVRRLLALRARHPVFSRGRDRILALTPELFAYARVLPDEVAIIAVNLGEAPATVPLPRELGARALRDALSGQPLSTVEVAAGETRVVLADAAASALHDELQEPQPASVPVVVRGAPRGELRLVGSAPEIGAWDVSRALVLERAGDGTARGELAVPQGAAIAYKLVAVSPGGEATWESGPNRYLLAGAGAAIDHSWAH